MRRRKKPKCSIVVSGYQLDLLEPAATLREDQALLGTPGSSICRDYRLWDGSTVTVRLSAIDVVLDR